MSATSRLRRVQHWTTFMRHWHVVDANCQDIKALSNKVAYYLCGKHKLIWHPETDCGDHVVVVNTRLVAMHGFDWKHTLFHFDRRYPQGRRDIEAYHIHDYDPCRVFFMFTSKEMLQFYRSSVPRRNHLNRLHLFPDTDVPDFIRKNIGNQLELVQPVPKKSTDYSAEERAKFPRLVRYPKEHIQDWHDPIEPKDWYPNAEAEMHVMKHQ